MNRRRLLATCVGVTLVTGVWALLPPARRRLTLAVDPLVVAGASHVHTTRSDGAGTPEQVAAAAHRAGLDFVILTDHGDGLRTPDPPRYVDAVLLVDAVEISTTGGHYAALGLGQAPYRLAGEPRDVLEDVRRLGGFGIVAHADSPKGELRWRDWSPPVDGLEWLNADSEWRDESRTTLLRALLSYWFRGPETIVALFDRPSETLARWDRLTAQARIVGIAGHDAHARLPIASEAEPGEGRALGVPSYRSGFQAMAIRVRLDAPLGLTDASASSDVARLLAGVRAGHVFTVIDGVAGPAALVFTATSPAGRASMGDDLGGPGAITLLAELTPAVPGATVVMIKNGQELAVANEPRLSVVHSAGEGAAVYRVEVRLAGAPGTPPVPWIAGNPIYVTRDGRAKVAAPVMRAEVVRVLSDPMAPGAWTVERQPASEAHAETGTAPAGAAAEHLAWRLANGQPSGQYAALALHLPPGVLAGADRLVITMQAAHPMRLSVQFRVPEHGGLRWQRSVYLDTSAREVVVPFAEMTPIEAPPGTPLDLAHADTLLLVVDTVNNAPGTAGGCWVGRVATERTGGPATSAP